jgi:PST family polysaccharide transporter
MIFIAGGQAIKLFVHVTSIIVLSRLLGPADFGIFAMISPVLALFAIVRDGGLTSAILQRKSISDAELTSLFWISVSWGVGLGALLALAAPLIARFYGEPRLVNLVYASSAIVIAGSLSLQHMTLLNRALRFRTLAAIDAGSLAFGYVIAAVIALLTPSYWALWAANATTAGVICAAGWTACRWRPGRPRLTRSVTDMLRTGGSVTISGLFDFLIRSVDTALIGRFRGSFELGLYNRAYRIVLLPLIFVSAPLDRLVLPSLVRMHDHPERYRKVYRLALQAPLLAILPAMVTITAIPEPVCRLLLGQGWTEAAPLLAWLSVAGALQLVTSSLGSLLISQGRASELTALNAASLVLACVAFSIGISFGALGVAAAYATSEIIRAPAAICWATRKGPLRTRDVFATLLPFLLSALCGYAAVSWAGRQLLSGPLLMATSMAISYTIALSGLILSETGREGLNEAIKAARDIAAPLGLLREGGRVRQRVAALRCAFSGSRSGRRHKHEQEGVHETQAIEKPVGRG